MQETKEQIAATRQRQNRKEDGFDTWKESDPSFEYGFLFFNRERYYKGGTVSRGTFDGNRALIQFENPFYHRKPQAVSGRERFILSEKFIKNMSQRSLVHANACVGNCNQEAALLLL